MSESTSKRTRGEETCADDDNPEESSGASSQDTLGNGDTEVFSTVIPLMTNLNVLKTCRLVCKSWNQFACQAIRKRPWVYYFIDESFPDDVDHALNLIVENKNLRLPSPFGNIKIFARSFREKSFLRYLKYVRDNENNYSIELYISNEDENRVDPVELQRVLTTNVNNFKITKLVLNGKGKIIEDGPCSDIFQPEKIRLPHLQMLAIDVLAHDKIVILCENLSLYSPLKRIRIYDFTCEEKLKKVMPLGGMKSVERFCLSIRDPISLEVWNYVCARVKEIPCIKRLKMNFPQSFFDDERYYNGFKAVIEHFADSLETIKGYWLPVFKNKCFPKLREIYDSRFGQYQSDFSFPVERYPLLKKATFGNYMNNYLEYHSFEEQSPGIEDLSFKSPSVVDPDLILKFISLAGMIFPNICRFSITQCLGLQFTPSMLSIICKSFPKLTVLELRVNLKDDRTLSGLRLIVDEWLQESWPVEKIPREVSLLDFQGLEKLTLGAYVIITRHLFLYCLSKIPRLKYLTFYLNGDASAADVRDSVGHLTRVTVVILSDKNPKRQWVKEMKRLQKMLPSVVEIKEKYFESQK